MGHNKYSYFTINGIAKGAFNIYHGVNGFIYIVMGKGHCKLTLEQIEDLKIDCYKLIDFDPESFNRAYDPS